MDISIDFFRASDFESLADLTKRSFKLNAWNVDKHLPRQLGGEVFFHSIATRALHENSNSCLVARHRSTAVGYIIYGVDLEIERQIGFKTATIILFCVSQEYSGQGVGRLLLERACNILSGRGVKLLTVGTDANNYPALTLYQKAGFVSRLNWGTWRLYPSFTRLPIPKPHKLGPWTGKEEELKLAYLNAKPLSWFRDSRISPRALVGLRRKLGDLVVNSIKDGQAKALIAKEEGFFKTRTTGLLVWEEDQIAEKFLNSEGLEKRVFRVTDLMVARGFEGRGIASQLLASFCDQVLAQSHCVEAWVAMDDWASLNIVSKCSFRLSHIATVLHRWF